MTTTTLESGLTLLPPCETVVDKDFPADCNHGFKESSSTFIEPDSPMAVDPRNVKVSFGKAADLHNESYDRNLQDPDSRMVESLKNRLSRKLYERENQQSQLLHAYGRLKARQSPEFILISGPSGSGKTHLAKSLSNVVHDDGGMLLTGKFDQLRKPQPYKAFVGAFTEFASLMSQDQHKLVATRNAVLDAVGDGAGVITDMIPALEKVMGHRMATMNKRGAISSFVFVFQMFVKALCSPQHPLVLVLEDMQFSDPCSLDLLTSLLNDGDSKGAVFIGTCEENIPSDSPLSTMLRKLEDAYGVKITNIQVENFTRDEVHEILLHELQLPLDQLSELADVMFTQTQGNLFYLTEFTQWLEEEKLLKYDPNLRQWHWDKHEVSLTISCGRVGDFLIDKLERLPSVVQEVLTVASCLDSVLDEDLLRIILDVDVQRSLEIAAAHGLLTIDRQQQIYSFAHDVTQSAAYAMIPHNNRSAFHLTIGRKMRERLDEHMIEKHIFTVVGQFCLSADIIQDEEERAAVAILCLHAGRMAAKCSTFRTASVYLNCGIKLLGSDCWREQYNLSLQLHNAAAEMALCTSSYSQMDELLNAVFDNIHVFRDKLQAHATRIFSLGVRDLQQQAIVEGQEVLKELDERIPERLYKTRLLCELARVRRMLRGKSDSMLMRLDPLEDPTKLAALQILDLMFLSSLIARPSFVPYIILKMMKMTLKYGLSPWAANSFATYGLLCCKVGNVDEAFRFGQLALQMLERSQHREFLPRVYAAVYGCIHCWKRPIVETLEPLRLAHRVGLETGDLEFSFLNSNLFCLNSLEAGETLDRVENNVKSFCDLMTARKQEGLLQLGKVFLQTLHHFMGFTNDPLALSGDVVDFGDVYRHGTETGNETLKTAVMVERALIAYIFNAYDLANELAGHWRGLIFNIPPGADLYSACCFDSLISLAFARRHKNGRGKHLRIAKGHIRRFKKWATNSPHNCADKLFLLEAELASIIGQPDVAYEKYACANAFAADSGCLWVQAIANERAAEHLVGRDEMDLAKVYFSRAYHLWERWSAYAKARRLRADCESKNIYVASAQLR